MRALDLLEAQATGSVSSDSIEFRRDSVAESAGEPDVRAGAPRTGSKVVTN